MSPFSYTLKIRTSGHSGPQRQTPGGVHFRLGNAAAPPEAPSKIKSLLPSPDCASNSTAGWVRAMPSCDHDSPEVHRPLARPLLAASWQGRSQGTTVPSGFPGAIHWLREADRDAWHPTWFSVCLVLFPCGPISAIRLSRKSRKNAMDAKHPEGCKGWTRKRLGIHEGLWVLLWWRYELGGVTFQTSETAKLLFLDHRRKERRDGIVGRITYFF